jgi:hypothetical protein
MITVAVTDEVLFAVLGVLDHATLPTIYWLLVVKLKLPLAI